MTPHKLIRVMAVAFYVFATAAFAESPDVVAALADRSKFSEAEWPNLYYFSTWPHTGEKAKNVEIALKLTVSSNSRQQVLQRCLPQRVLDAEGKPVTGLWRINLADLKWRYEDWFEVCANRNPTTPKGVLPLVIPAAWFIQETTDMHESDSYDLLFFNGKIPKTRAEWQAEMDIITDPDHAVAVVEGKSQVSVSGQRRVTFNPIPNGYASFTQDSLKLVTEKDPLENLLADYQHDGEEHIAWCAKLWIGDAKNPGEWGVLARYALFDGKGNRVGRAPVDLVRDYLRYSGYDEIRYPVSCFGCHADGANSFTRNELLIRIQSGMNVYADPKAREEIERKYLSNLKTRLERLNDDFARTVTLACDGVTPKEASEALRLTLAEYRRPLDLEMTAAELAVDEKKWRTSLADAAVVTARLSSLLYGEVTETDDTRGTIPRDAWEQEYLKAYEATHGGTPTNLSGVRAPEKKVEAEPAAEKPKQVEPVRPSQPRPSNNNRRGRF